MRQLGLFESERSQDCWVTGTLPVRDGLSRYVLLIRSASDPQRSPRPPGGRADRAPHRTLAKIQAEDWHAPILRIVAAEGPLTFNAISVLLTDKTADVTWGTPFEEALWQLVEARRLAFTMKAPVLFRCEGS